MTNREILAGTLMLVITDLGHKHEFSQEDLKWALEYVLTAVNEVMNDTQAVVETPGPQLSVESSGRHIEDGMAGGPEAQSADQSNSKID